MQNDKEKLPVERLIVITFRDLSTVLYEAKSLEKSNTSIHYPFKFYFDFIPLLSSCPGGSAFVQPYGMLAFTEGCWPIVVVENDDHYGGNVKSRLWSRSKQYSYGAPPVDKGHVGNAKLFFHLQNDPWNKDIAIESGMYCSEESKSSKMVNLLLFEYPDLIRIIEESNTLTDFDRILIYEQLLKILDFMPSLLEDLAIYDFSEWNSDSRKKRMKDVINRIQILLAEKKNIIKHENNAQQSNGHLL